MYATYLNLKNTQSNRRNGDKKHSPYFINIRIQAEEFPCFRECF